ncbi:hypothetical protein FGIG_02127 [Fasciola gigantica]|uniref:MD-2-related lipid-recognition domain-containing protein n=1 Tax=Fasciola gigantica TaxID=46835 RepID=A0A504YT80_FASGI|nr:hypothetical protein FGIG_02127 [Fasciola gigantica]
MFRRTLMLIFVMAVGMATHLEIPICENSNLLVNSTVIRSSRQFEFVIQFRTNRTILSGHTKGTYWLRDLLPITQPLTDLCAFVDSGCPLEPGDMMYTLRYRMRTRRRQVS